MSVTGWHLIGSAASLEDLCAMVVERMFWSTCEALPTANPKVWRVVNGNGPRERMRIRQAGKRYRLERVTTR